MSRIGKNPVTIPSGVTVDVKGNIVTVTLIANEAFCSRNPSLPGFA